MNCSSDTSSLRNWSKSSRHCNVQILELQIEIDSLMINNFAHQRVKSTWIFKLMSIPRESIQHSNPYRTTNCTMFESHNMFLFNIIVENQIKLLKSLEHNDCIELKSPIISRFSNTPKVVLRKAESIYILLPTK